MSWAGNDKVGEGKMTVVESKPNDAVRLKVDFVKPFEGTSNSDFAFKPEGDGTAVTWTMSAHHNFIEKAFCLVMNGKKMIGDDLEKGLAQMKALAEAKAYVPPIGAAGTLRPAFARMIELRLASARNRLGTLCRRRRTRGCVP